MMDRKFLTISNGDLISSVIWMYFRQAVCIVGQMMGCPSIKKPRIGWVSMEMLTQLAHDRCCDWMMQNYCKLKVADDLLESSHQTGDSMKEQCDHICHRVGTVACYHCVAWNLDYRCLSQTLCLGVVHELVWYYEDCCGCYKISCQCLQFVSFERIT